MDATEHIRLGIRKNRPAVAGKLTTFVYTRPELDCLYPRAQMTGLFEPLSPVFESRNSTKLTHCESASLQSNFRVNELGDDFAVGKDFIEDRHPLSTVSKSALGVDWHLEPLINPTCTDQRRSYHAS